jgi:hypothetical protein
MVDGMEKWRFHYQMKAFSWRVYLVAIAVAIVSFWFASRFSQNQWSEALTATPIPIALITVLYQIFRDNLAHEREMMRQRENNDFILAATSHMANTSFDKHVAFAEKYVSEVHSSISSLIQTGATQNAINLACKLRAIRLEYTVWETEDVSKTLDEFEHALQKIGAIMDGFRDLPASEERSQKLKEAREIFKKVLGYEEESGVLSDEIVWTTVIQRMRKLLGIAELTTLRLNYARAALERCK